ncbi:MAG: CoA-binding protein [Dehalococcoidia bacterium]|nr:CoA-binding protein [Dehalococcoidia bacterium]
MEHDIIKELEGIFYPRSVAIVGVSEKANNLGYRWLKSLLDAGFPRVYPVNPKGGEMHSQKVYGSISEIPGHVDLAILIIPREAVPGVARECAEKGTKGIVLYTSGFGESGADGRRLQEEIVRIARRGGTRVMGPSCLGPYNPSAKLITQYVLPRQAGSVGVISHSGFLFNFLLMSVTATGIGPSKGVSCGSDCDLSFVDFLEYLGQDEQTKVIIGYLEGISDGKRLLRVAREISKRKPIIILKGGETETGRRASASHTATLAVPSAVWKSVCSQTGIISVDSFEELIDTLRALHYLPRTAGNRVAVVTAPGGLAVTASDACQKLGLELPRLTRRTRGALASLVGGLGTNVDNPIDLGPMGAMAAAYYVGEAVKLAIRDPNIDMLLTAYIGPPTFDEAKDRETAEDFVREIGAVGKPAVFSGASLQGWDRGELKFLAENRIPVYPEATRAARALARLVEYSEFATGT